MDTPHIRAKDLRRDMTPAERAVWSVLRARGLSGRKFRRQVPIGSFIVDFLCIAERLVVEIDGASHDGREGYDQRRDAYLHDKGFRVVRISNDEVRRDLGSAMAMIASQFDRPPLT